MGHDPTLVLSIPTIACQQQVPVHAACSQIYDILLGVFKDTIVNAVILEVKNMLDLESKLGSLVFAGQLSL